MVLWVTRKGAIPQSTKLWRGIAIWTPLLPVIAISFGWIFTEIGRQPWIVYGLMTTQSGVSPAVSATEVLVSMVVYTLLYAVLAVIEVKLFLTYVRRGAEPFEEIKPPEGADHEDAPFQFAY
jgi:cytochrome d ubiquinol oxidase subunit I